MSDFINENDFLGRKDFIELIQDTSRYFADNKKKISYGINGQWGCGKSWILNEIEKLFQDEQSLEPLGDKYLVIRFNSWEYDYYNEPLLAFLFAIKNQLEKEIKLSKNIKISAKILLDELIEPFLACVSLVTMNPIFYCGGKLFLGKIKSIKSKIEASKKEEEKKACLLNPNIELDNLMKNIISSLKKITGTGIIPVILIDELDRCLPDYAIKTLERMHHIFDNVENIQMIYAYDKEKLGHIVSNLYGSTVKAEDYLKKFISFEYSVDKGVLNSNYLSIQKELFEQFDFIYSDEFSIKKAFSNILPEIDIRERLNIFQKIIFVNNLIKNKTNKTEEKYDYAILYVELFLANCLYKDISIKDKESSINFKKELLEITFSNPKADFYLSHFFDSLQGSHDGFLYEKPDTKFIETVIYNLLNDFIKDDIRHYATKEEIQFYFESIQFINNFYTTYKYIN